MGINITAPNNGSDYLEYKNTAGTSLAKVGGYDDGSSNGHLELYTTASGTPTERVRIDSAGNVGIGTGSPAADLEVKRTGAVNVKAQITSAYESALWLVNGGGSEVSVINAGGSNVMSLRTNNTERMRIDSSGNLLVGGSSFTQGGIVGSITASGSGTLIQLSTNTTANKIQMQFNNPNGQVGYILTNGSSTTYATSSDYRLKENIQPIQGALDVVQQLNPVTYTWKADGSDGQGFIAHELQAVVPDCVTGEKDAVDAEGKPIYQGIDTSFLVATLTKAIQEQQEQINELKAQLTDVSNEVAALKGAA